MFAGLKRRLGMVEVTTSPKYITVEGISTLMLFKDMYNIWGNNTVAKYMFSQVRSSELKMLHFFGLDFLYVCQRIYDERSSRTPKRVLEKVIEELKANTWLGQVNDPSIKSITDLSVIHNQVPFPLKPFQAEFAQIFGKMVPAYRLKGYMLDAGAGTGKTVTDLIISIALHANKVIIVTPKNAAERVWEETIANILINKRKYWLSTDNRPPSLDDHYYICHYEQLEQLLAFVKANIKDFKDTFVILDESHNFNRLAADRTQYFIELCQMSQVSYCLWASGTPILALGVECIPFLKCVDPLFIPEAEERFRKIYGRDAKRANDILRNRIGHLKYHVPKQDVVKVDVFTEQVKVAMPDSDKYTLENISVILNKFVDTRLSYYEHNKKHYEGKYYEGIDLFVKTLRSETDKRQFRAYRDAFVLISNGFDPKTMAAEAQFCNQYELKTIMPTLPGSLKAEFKSARSVLKYVKLKVMGEALGTIVGGMRTKCHVDMVAHIDFARYIDEAKKKTLIFTSYVEVLEAVAEKVFHEGYNPGRVYGATNKDLSSIVAKFFKDEDLNPLCATYQSLSTAVPLTPANTLLLVNQPFRDAIKTQTIARAARLGQDSPVFVFDFLLDTGAKPNISTRSNDILNWSQQQVSQILGVTNVDTETLQLENSIKAQDNAALVFGLLCLESFDMDTANPVQADYLGALGELYEGQITGESMESLKLDDRLEPTEVKEETGFELPPYLFHGSAFMQDELMPGFQRSGEVTYWDNTESNEWLYATACRDSAVMLGIASSLAKKHDVKDYYYDIPNRTFWCSVECDIKEKDIYNLPVVLYTVRAEAEDGWTVNFNAVNGIKDEFKTQSVVTNNILKKEHLDLYKVFNGWKIVIEKKK